MSFAVLWIVSKKKISFPCPGSVRQWNKWGKCDQHLLRCNDMQGEFRICQVVVSCWQLFSCFSWNLVLRFFQLITYGMTRDEALDTMEKALDSYVIRGESNTNAPIPHYTGGDTMYGRKVLRKFIEHHRTQSPPDFRCYPQHPFVARYNHRKTVPEWRHNNEIPEWSLSPRL